MTFPLPAKAGSPHVTFIMAITRQTSKLLLTLTLVALTLMTGGLTARAEDKVDPPRQQTIAGYTIELVSPAPEGNHAVGQPIQVLFRVKDANGQPSNGLQIKLTAKRDYSGQVTAEHNGPRVPDIGPVALTPGTQPGDYQTTMTFGVNGHWILQLDSPAWQGVALKFRAPVGASDSKGAGFNLDWLLWLGVLVTVLTVVVISGRKGHVFPTPVEELQPPVPAPAGTKAVEQPETVAVSGN